VSEEHTVGELCGKAALPELLPALSSLRNLHVTDQLQDGHPQTNRQHIDKSLPPRKIHFNLNMNICLHLIAKTNDGRQHKPLLFT
jgi:hypothetical protein